MSLPLVKDKFSSCSVTNPENLISQYQFYRELSLYHPSLVVISYYPLKNILKKNNWEVEEKKKGRYQAYFHYSSKILFYQAWGIGAPYHATVIEELKVVFPQLKFYLLMGIAGGISSDLKIGDLVISKGAYRDEGTSYHYLKDSSSLIEADLNLYRQLYSIFVEGKSGYSWTTDAVYRETLAEMEYFREKKVKTVEMEASLHFSLGKFFALKMGAIFVISDLLSQDGWNHQFQGKIVREKFEYLIKRLINHWK